MNDEIEDILLTIESVLDRIAKLGHPNGEKAIIQIQEGADWIREVPK